ncbi:MAG: 23S rRNA (adenine(2503)-C(2))-methyltransferase RlmN [Bacteroidia bacterium]|nr:23S rRNA (adenine(2503)-C(2))-methyltransferase RlmN [Bacteroidia bacterium]
MKRTNLIGLSVRDIFDLIASEGYDYSHASSITNSIYKKRITDLSMISKIPKRLKTYLSEIAVPLIYEPIATKISTDKSVKYLFRNPEGQQFETVFIPDGRRNTVCVSTQSGCRMGCPFCVTARYGFHGNLDAGHIINQILSIPPAENVTHVVFMGMGEPLDNSENVLKACEILTAEWGMAMSHRNITISTVGITPAIIPFLEKSGCNLTLSLFSPFPGERINVVPAEKKYPALEIIEIMKNFPVKKKRRLSVAYVMISGVNDTDRHLEGLKKILSGSEIRVNLLPYHQVHGDVNVSSSGERMMYFKHNLVVSGISASVRRTRGADISAACGLLASGLSRSRCTK